MFRLDPDTPGADRVGCLLLLVVAALTGALTVLHLPPASSVEAFQRRHFVAVGTLHTLVLTAAILAALMFPIWLFVRSIFRARRR